MDPEVPYMIAGYYLVSIFFIFMGGLPVKPPFTWREPRGVAIGSSMFKYIESLVARVRAKASPLMSERNKAQLAAAWRGRFSYSVPIFGFVDSFFKNSDALSLEQREARSFFLYFSIACVLFRIFDRLARCFWPFIESLKMTTSKGYMRSD